MSSFTAKNGASNNQQPYMYLEILAGLWAYREEKGNLSRHLLQILNDKISKEEFIPKQPENNPFGKEWPITPRVIAQGIKINGYLDQKRTANRISSPISSYSEIYMNTKNKEEATRVLQDMVDTLSPLIERDNEIKRAIEEKIKIKWMRPDQLKIAPINILTMNALDISEGAVEKINFDNASCKEYITLLKKNADRLNPVNYRNDAHLHALYQVGETLFDKVIDKLDNDDEITKIFIESGQEIMEPFLLRSMVDSCSEEYYFGLVAGDVTECFAMANVAARLLKPLINEEEKQAKSTVRGLIYSA